MDLGARMRVAVVGGGWAGLAAAVELLAAGVEVVVYEAARRLGGRARSVVMHGQRLDNGQHILSGAYGETLRLMQQVGADPARLLHRVPLALCFPGAASERPFALRLPRLPAPWHLAVGLFSARGASLGEKLAALRCLRRWQGTGYRLAADCSLAALLDRDRQFGALRRFLWEPLCLAALNTPAADASAQVFLNVLRDTVGGARAASDLLLPAVELDALFAQPAAEFIRAHGGEIRLSARVEQIGESLGIAGERYAAVVLAVDAPHAAALLAQHGQTADLARLLAGYRCEPIATVYCAYPRELRLSEPMLGLAGGSPTRVGQWVFDRGALCGNDGLLAFVLSGRGAWEELDNSALFAALAGELAGVLRRRLPDPAWVRVVRERRATYSCRPALPRPPARTARRGLWLAGDYVCDEYPATLEAAVRSGVAAARGILGAPAAGQRAGNGLT
ncbi:hydroxysqualene dehydroxylase HpnE [Accumulibacter sp.]|uniref:hydroxysqualene dehydroxylase HpnE n=1 Tax=Accumulibacter sp. TaxID=2053492 RepID=UPI002C5D5ED3|nr:hydroxysqualene dehydroxylase HpnE [Accumulibacter sp.]HNH92833.1 hydroxysqualene dehydroxylase HpnE [Accumulibacter sp.]